MTLSKIRRGTLGCSEDVARRLLAALNEAATDVSTASEDIARELERTVSHATTED